MSHFKLKSKFVLAQLLTLLPLAVFIFFILDHWSDIERLTYLRKNYQLAYHTGLSLDREFNNFTSIASLLAQNPSVQYLDRDKALPLFYRHLSTLPASSDLLITDKDGHALLDALNSEETTPSASFAGKIFFQTMLAAKKPVISNFSDSSNQKDPQICFSAPVKNQFGQISGAVVLEIPASSLKDLFFLPEIPGENLRLFLLDREKTLVLDSSDIPPEITQRSLFQKDPLLLPLFQKAALGSFDHYKNPLFDKPVYGVISPLPASGWYLILSAPLENQLYPIFRTQLIFVVILFFTVVFSILLVTYFLRKFLAFL